MSGESQTTGIDSAAIKMARGHFMVMKILHFAMATGVVLFGAVALFITHKKMTGSPAMDNPLVVAAGVATAMAIVVSSILPRLYFRPGTMPVDVHVAMRKYQTFVLARAAVIESAALFCGIATLASCNVLPAGLLALCVAALVLATPSQREFVSLMKRRGSRP